MKTVTFPYAHTTYSLEVPDETAVLVSRVDELAGGNGAGNAEPADENRGAAIVRAAMEHPIGSPRLRELAAGRPDCVIIISDHTRPVPSRDILPEMIRELREGNPAIEITLLVATGFHRATRPEELEAKLGTALYSEFRNRIVIHNAHDPSTNVKVGQLPSGPDCILDKVAVNASLLIAEGFIEPHFFAGFSGGRKSILPGIADAVTVMGNHCSKFIDHPCCRTGILEGNPMHEDMLAAARMAHLAYIVNVVVDDQHRTVAAFAGDFEEAHLQGCAFIESYVHVSPVPADIVITTNGGYPLDQNAYQSPKGMTAAEATVKEGGVIIMLASCSDGTGGDDYYHLIADEPDIETAYQKFLDTPQNETEPDQWCSQIFARIARKFTVIFVADPEQREMIEGLKVQYAASLGEAYRMARALKGENASLTCIPNGISVVVS